MITDGSNAPSPSTVAVQVYVYFLSGFLIYNLFAFRISSHRPFFVFVLESFRHSVIVVGIFFANPENLPPFFWQSLARL